MNNHIKPVVALGVLASLVGFNPLQRSEAFDSQIWFCFYEGHHYATLEYSDICPNAHGDGSDVPGVISFQSIGLSALPNGQYHKHEQGDPINCFGDAVPDLGPGLP